MKSNELRIGNLVQDRNGVIMRVVSIHEDGTIYCDFEGNVWENVWGFNDNNPCFGVELTEEILLKCGFDWYKLNDDLGYALKKVSCGIVFKYDIHDFEVSVFVNNEVVSVKHLHQLQNLYFALCGKELEVNLQVKTKANKKEPNAPYSEWFKKLKDI